jgi:DNA-binding transcriptional LysR family regulator
MPALIAPSIAEYNELYPDVTVHLTATSRMLDLVEEGFDLAIWFGAEADASLITRRLAWARLVICASPKYLAKRSRPAHPSEIAKHSSIIYYDAGIAKDGRDWLFTGPDGKDVSVRMSGTLETNSPIALRSAALLGQGLIIAPAPMVLEDLRTGALVPILTEFLLKQYSIDVLYPHREHLPAKVRTFIDLLAKNFHQMDWDCTQSIKQSTEGHLANPEISLTP